MSEISLMKDYNLNSDWQHQANKHLYQHLKDQVKEISKGNHSELTLADLGCSFGKNSMDCIKAALDGCEKQTRINIYLDDLPSNDFGEVFKCLDEDISFKSHPACSDKDVSVFIIGKSFYEQVLPTNQIDLSFCFLCLHWLKDIPLSGMSLFPASVLSTPNEKANIISSAHEQLVEFFEKRACELKKGGRLLVSFMDGDFADPISLEWKNFLVSRQLDPHQFKNVTIPVHFRSLVEIKAAVSQVKNIFLPLYLDSVPCNGLIQTHVTVKHATFNSLLMSIKSKGLMASPKEYEALVEDFYTHLKSVREEYDSQIHLVVLKRI